MQQLTVTGSFTHENRSLFLLRGSDSFDGSRFIPLDEALEQKSVIVHETATSGQLEVENLSDVFDLYAQAGDVVKRADSPYPVERRSAIEEFRGWVKHRFPG